MEWVKTECLGNDPRTLFFSNTMIKKPHNPPPLPNPSKTPKGGSNLHYPTPIAFHVDKLDAWAEANDALKKLMATPAPWEDPDYDPDKLNPLDLEPEPAVTAKEALAQIEEWLKKKGCEFEYDFENQCLKIAAKGYKGNEVQVGQIVVPIYEIPKNDLIFVITHEVGKLHKTLAAKGYTILHPNAVGVSQVTHPFKDQKAWYSQGQLTDVGTKHHQIAHKKADHAGSKVGTKGFAGYKPDPYPGWHDDPPGLEPKKEPVCVCHPNASNPFCPIHGKKKLVTALKASLAAEEPWYVPKKNGRMEWYDGVMKSGCAANVTFQTYHEPGVVEYLWELAIVSGYEDGLGLKGEPNLISLMKSHLTSVFPSINHVQLIAAMKATQFVLADVAYNTNAKLVYGVVTIAAAFSNELRYELSKALVPIIIGDHLVEPYHAPDVGGDLISGDIHELVSPQAIEKAIEKLIHDTDEKIAQAKATKI